MAKKGLRAWVKENWVDIANKRSDGSYPKCGRSGGEKIKKVASALRKASKKHAAQAKKLQGVLNGRPKKRNRKKT